MIQIKIPSLNDVWMDNGTENLYRVVKGIAEVRPEIVQASISEDAVDINILEKNKFFSYFKDVIINLRDTNIFYEKKDKKTGAVRNIKKDFVIMQYGTQIGNKNVLKEQIYNDQEIESLLDETIESIEKKKKSCILCSRGFSKKIGNLKQSIYPFSTKIKSLSGVRSETDSEHNIKLLKDYFDTLCPVCYLTGGLQWTDSGLVYRTYLPGGQSIFFLPAYSNLEKLHQIKSRYISSLKIGDGISNVSFIIKKLSGEERDDKPVGINTLLLGFLDKTIAKCFIEKQERVSRWETKQIYDLDSWIMVEVPSGTVKNIKQRRLGIQHNVLDFISSTLESGFSIYEKIILRSQMRYMDDFLIFFDDTNVLREKLAKSILNDDYAGFASAMIPGKRSLFYIYLDREDHEKFRNEFIYKWRWEQMGLNHEELETVTKAAKIVAKISTRHVGDLYKLDKTRNITEFLEGLQQISRRVLGFKEEDYEKDSDLKFLSFPEMEKFVALVHSREKEFRDIKSTLIIYTCMEMASTLKRKFGKNKKQEE